MFVEPTAGSPVRVVGAAIGGAPRCAALIEGRLRRCLVEDRSVCERNVRRHIGLLLGRKADCTAAAAEAPETPVDKRVKHQAQKLIRQPKGRSFGAGRHFAVDLGKSARAQTKERRRNAAIDVEEVGQRIGDILLIDVETTVLGEAGGEVQIDVVGVVTETVAGAQRQIEIAQPGKSRAPKPAGRGEDRIPLRHVAAGRKVRLHCARERCRATHVRGGGTRGIESGEINGAGGERQIAGHRERRSGRPGRSGRQCAAGIDLDRTDRACSGERGAIPHGNSHSARRRIDDEGSLLHVHGRNERRICAGQRPRAGVQFLTGLEIHDIADIQRAATRAEQLESVCAALSVEDSIDGRSGFEESDVVGRSHEDVAVHDAVVGEGQEIRPEGEILNSGAAGARDHTEIRQS